MGRWMPAGPPGSGAVYHCMQAQGSTKPPGGAFLVIQGGRTPPHRHRVAAFPEAQMPPIQASKPQIP